MWAREKNVKCLKLQSRYSELVQDIIGEQWIRADVNKCG